MRGMARIAIVLVGVALVAAVAASSAAAASEEVGIYLTGPPGHRYQNTLQLKLLPRQGAAVVTTLTAGTDFENGGGVAYATRTRKALRAGRVDVHFPGLGRIVGRVVGDGEPRSSRSRTGCAATEVTESGHFVGHLVFRGAGGYRTWRARRAESVTKRNTSCGEGAPPKTLFGYLGETGTPALEGGSSLVSVLGSGYENGKRSVQFIAEIHGRGPEEAAGFTVFDHEWLAGHRIAANRWMSRRGVPLGDHFEIAPGARKPPSATLRPPAPFSGEATYSRQGHKLTGGLSVQLLGLKLRLAGLHTVAYLDNSE
jgi:hypothetical protein